MKDKMKNILHPETKKQLFLLAFLVNLFLAFLVFTPIVLRGGGILAFCEDFAGETLPYRYLAREAIRSGDIFWNWNLDLGSDFMQSFGLSYFTDPFRLIPTLLPENCILTCSYWLMMLRYALAGAGMALYLNRHFKSKGTILIGSMLYAFSGFQATILVFDMLSDVSVFFPFYMTALEELVEENKRGRFAFWVFYLCSLSVTMFVGVFIFSIIYYCVKYYQKNKAFFIGIGRCMTEGIIGGCIAGLALLPTLYALVSDSRAAYKLIGSMALSFDSTRIMYIIRAWLLPNEAMSNMSSIITAEWMSVSAYLPLIGATLMVAYLWKKDDNRLRKVLITFLIMSVVPFLNNLFMMESFEPYCRWYFMLLLVAITCSCAVIEHYREYPVQKAGIACFLTVLIYVFILYRIPWYNDTETLTIYRPSRLWIGVMLGLVGILYTTLISRYKNRKKFLSYLFVGVASFSVITNMLMCYDYQIHSNNNANPDGNSPIAIKNELLGTGEVLDRLNIEVLPYRTRFWRHYYNYNMVYGVPNTGSFLSIIANSTYKLYENTGNPRLHAIPPVEGPGFDSLVSAKYYIWDDTIIDYINKEDCVLLDHYNNGNRELSLYEDTTALPIAYTYDTYIKESDYLKINAALRTTAAMGTLVIPDEKEELVKDVLDYNSEKYYGLFNNKLFNEKKREHLDEVCYDFSKTNKTFTFHIDASKDKYAFVTVPYSEYWSVTVNGTEQKIIESNGLMAVPVSEGINEVVFTYKPKMTIYGLYLMIIGFIAYGAYMFLQRKLKKS